MPPVVETDVSEKAAPEKGTTEKEIVVRTEDEAAKLNIDDTIKKVVSPPV